MKRGNGCKSVVLMDLLGHLAAFVKVLASFNHLSAESAHGCVLLFRVAFGYNHTTNHAIARGTERNGLTMIATGGGDKAEGFVV